MTDCLVGGEEDFLGAAPTWPGQFLQNVVLLTYVPVKDGCIVGELQELIKRDTQDLHNWWDGSANLAILMLRRWSSSLVQVIKSVANDFPTEGIRLQSSIQVASSPR